MHEDPAPEAPAATELLKKRAEVEAKMREADKIVEMCKQDIAALDGQLITHFQETGMQRVTLDGFTFYLRRDLWAGVVDGVERPVACNALRAAGLGDLVQENFNSRSLSAYVRERDKAGEALPAEFDGVIKVSETFKVGVRTA